MRRLTARPALPAFVGLILLLGVAACGGNSSSKDADTPDGGLSSITVTGKVGAAPTVTWKQPVAVTKLASKTLVTGTGATTKSGDQVLTHIWIGDGYTKKKAFSTYDTGGTAQPIEVGSSQVPKGIETALTGHAIGSRIVVAAPPADAFGSQGQTSLGIGNSDTVVFVVDLIGEVLKQPQGTAVKAPKDAPQLVQAKGAPTGFDFGSAPKQAPKQLQVIPLVKGTGATVKSGGSVVVNYLGVTYGGTKPFDESYSKGQPFSTKIGAGAVIKGWDKGLVGQRVGSRVELVIPSRLAYGDKAQGAIKANSTLVFVVDILAAY